MTRNKLRISNGSRKAMAFVIVITTAAAPFAALGLLMLNFVLG